MVLEVGYERRHSDPGEWKFGALGAIEISQTMEVMGELRRAQEKFLGGGETIMNVGVKARLSENAKLLAALGKGLGRGADSPSLLIFLGLQLVFGQEHR